MTPRENVLASIYCENPEYVPMTAEAIHICGVFCSPDQPAQSGPDAFGVPWVVTKEGSIPQPGYVRFDDITEWRKYVEMPNADDIDVRAMAEAERGAVPQPDREEKLFSAITACGLFERLVSLMGFENALMALLLEPEACMDFFDAVTEYKIKIANKIIDHYAPDVFISCDDVATAKGLFMSPETYRKLIKPFDRRYVEAVTARGVVFQRHCCGMCSELLDDFLDCGVRMWHSAQPMNDLSALLDRYKGRLAIEGGWDSSGPASYIGAGEEEIREEVRRCMSEYKKPGFIFMPTLLNERGNSLFVGDERLGALEDEWRKHRDF